MRPNEQEPVIGILYNRHKQSSQLAPLTERLQLLARAYPMTFKLFSIRSLDLEARTAGGIQITESFIRETTTPLPPLLYNYAVHVKTSSIDTMRQLRLARAPIVINPINRFHQYYVFDLLASRQEFADQLFPHSEFHPDRVAEDLKNRGKLLLLPQKGLYHRRGVLVELVKTRKGSAQAQLTVGRHHHRHSLHTLPRVLSFMLKRSPSFSLAVGNLLTHKGVPVEARAYAQKQASGHWTIIETLHKQELFARFGTRPQSSALSDILPHSVIDDIKRNALALCSHLDLFMPQIGSLTFDYLLTPDGKPYLAYTGGVEQHSFLSALPAQESWDKWVAGTVEYGLHVWRTGGQTADDLKQTDD